MTDLEVVYIILALQALGMLISVSLYNYKRLGIEEARSVTLTQQRDNLQAYYDARLSVEKAKLDVEKAKLEQRRNGALRYDTGDVPLICEHGKELCACRNKEQRDG